MTYVIEKGVPLPANFRRDRYPFGAMEVGDSFAVPTRKVRAAISSASQHGKRTGRKYVSRKSDDGIRIWRVA